MTVILSINLNSYCPLLCVIDVILCSPLSHIIDFSIERPFSCGIDVFLCSSLFHRIDYIQFLALIDLIDLNIVR